MFFIDANTEMGIKERKFLSKQLGPPLSGPCVFLWLKAILAIPRDHGDHGDHARFRR